MIRATLVQKLTTGSWLGDARLYRLSEPVPFYGVHKGKTDHVIISANDVQGSGPETLIFPARTDGTTINMLDMRGSLKGELDHEQAIRCAGWEVSP